MKAATSVESANIWAPILRARMPGVRMEPDSVRFTGVCQPLWSMRMTYMLVQVESTR